MPRCWYADKISPLSLSLTSAYTPEAGLTSSSPRAGRWLLSSSSSASSFRALFCWMSLFLLSRSLCRVVRSSSSSRLSCSCSSWARNPRCFSNSSLKRCLCISTFSCGDIATWVMEDVERCHWEASCFQVWGSRAREACPESGLIFSQTDCWLCSNSMCTPFVWRMGAWHSNSLRKVTGLRTSIRQRFEGKHFWIQASVSYVK